jgi:hypothetical protein
VANVTAAAVVVAGAFIGFVLLWDTARVALSTSVASDYHFGSESMLAHGGWPYRSRTSYVVVGLSTSALLIGSGVAALYALKRRRLGLALAAAGTTIVVLTWSAWPPG